MPDTGTLYLIPVPIAPESGTEAIPGYNLQVVRRLKHFIAEDAKHARRNLKLFGYEDLPSAEINILDEHTEHGELNRLLEPLLNGIDAGLMSDAGCPGIADPGAKLIAICHHKGILVTPLTGPSSIVLSIMASGFNGQNFAFNGYLPVDKTQRVKRLKELEHLAGKSRQAQFFIETPYRNEQLLQAILGALQPDTRLFIGRNIGTPGAQLVSASVAKWRSRPMEGLHKVPVVFGIFR